MLADVATGQPLGHAIDIAGPETRGPGRHGAAYLRRTGEKVRLVPTWRGVFDTSMAGEVLLPATMPAWAASPSMTG